MNVLDLFSGIGGFSLGLERAGMRTVAFCEIEPFARQVLKKHWPQIPIYEDVRTLTGRKLSADGIAAEVICGGFPCQDISFAGKGAGIEGERSGLWADYARIIGEVRPLYVIVENVAALVGRGLDRVLGDLAALGYDAEWHCIPASAVGAPHRRDRIWIVANTRSGRCRQPSEWQNQQQGRTEVIGPGQAMAALPHAAYYAAISEGIRRGDSVGQWRSEPDVGRVANGIPLAMERIAALGNSVVPQIPEIIGRAIMTSVALTSGKQEAE